MPIADMWWVWYTLPALQWMTAMFFRSFPSHWLTSTQNSRMSSMLGGLWSSNGNRWTQPWNRETSYVRSEHLTAWRIDQSINKSTKTRLYSIISPQQTRSDTIQHDMRKSSHVSQKLTGCQHNLLHRIATKTHNHFKPLYTLTSVSSRPN